MSTVNKFPATIANGATISNVVDVRENTVCGFEIPAAFTGVALTLQGASDSAGPFQVITDKTGATYSMVVAAGKNVSINPYDLIGFRFFRLVSGSAEGAARTVNIMARYID